MSGLILLSVAALPVLIVVYPGVRLLKRWDKKREAIDFMHGDTLQTGARRAIEIFILSTSIVDGCIYFLAVWVANAHEDNPLASGFLYGILIIYGLAVLMIVSLLVTTGYRRFLDARNISMIYLAAIIHAPIAIWFLLSAADGQFVIYI